MEFSVNGDVVNVASRLEKATRELGCAIAVSEACLRAASGQAHAFDASTEVRLRGREEPILVHTDGCRA